MLKVKRSTYFIAAVVLVVILACTVIPITGCKSTVTTETTAIATTAAETAAAETTSDVTATLGIISFRGSDKAADDYITTSFNKKYPNVKVEMNYIDTTKYTEVAVNNILMGADGCDIFLAWMQGYSRPMYDADGFLDLTGWDLLKQVPQGCWDQLSGSYPNPYIGIPTANAIMNAFYNLDLFKKYGLEVPKNYEEFLSVCEAFKANGVFPIEVGGKDKWPLSILFSNFEGNLRKDPKDNVFENLDTQLKPTVEWFKFMWDKGYIDPASLGLSHDQSVTNFATGKFPMFPMFQPDIGAIMAQKGDFELGIEVVPFNSIPGTDPVVVTFYDCMWSINKKSDNVDLAKAWIETAVKEHREFIKVTGYLPLYPIEDAASINPNIVKFQQVLDDRKTVVDFASMYSPSPSVEETWDSEIEEVWLGNETVDEAVANIKKAYDEAKAEQKK